MGGEGEPERRVRRDDGPAVYLRGEHDLGADDAEQHHRGGQGAVPPTVPPHHAHVPPRRQAVPRGEGGGAQAPAHRGRHAGRAPDLIHRQARHPPARVQGYGDAPARGVQGWVQREAAGALVGTRRGGEAFGLDLGRRRQGQGEVICTIRIVRFL